MKFPEENRNHGASPILVGAVLLLFTSCGLFKIEEPEITAEFVGSIFDVAVHKPIQIAFSDPVDEFPDITITPSVGIQSQILNSREDTLTIRFSRALSYEVTYEMTLSGRNIVNGMVSFTTIATLDDAQNDDYEEAQPVESGKWYGGLINTVFDEADEDWYKLEGISSGGMITVTLTELDENLDMRLFNPDGTHLSTSAAGGNLDETIQVSASQTGSHYIKVFSPLTNPSSYYHLLAEF